MRSTIDKFGELHSDDPTLDALLAAGFSPSDIVSAATPGPHRMELIPQLVRAGFSPVEIREWNGRGVRRIGDQVSWVEPGEMKIVQLAPAPNTTRPHAQPPCTVRVRRTAPRRRGTGGRPRAVARSSSRSGDSGDDGSSEGDGEPPPPALLHALRGLGLALSRVRWCRVCHRFAYAIDAYQRDQLQALGFRDGLCPDCRRSAHRFGGSSPEGVKE